MRESRASLFLRKLPKTSSVLARGCDAKRRAPSPLTVTARAPERALFRALGGSHAASADSALAAERESRQELLSSASRARDTEPPAPPGAGHHFPDDCTLSRGRLAPGTSALGALGRTAALAVLATSTPHTSSRGAVPMRGDGEREPVPSSRGDRRVPNDLARASGRFSSPARSRAVAVYINADDPRGAD